MPEIDPTRIQAMVQSAIDDGATTVEEIHRAVAAAPLETLKSIAPISGPAGVAQDLTSRSIGLIYDTIRQVNEQVGAIAEGALSRVSGEAAASPPPES